MKKIGLYNINKHLKHILKTDILSNEEIVIILNETQTIENIISKIKQFLEDNNKNLKKDINILFYEETLDFLIN